MSDSSEQGWASDPVIRRIAEDLRNTDLFKSLTVHEAQHVATICGRRLLGPGDSLFAEGDPAEHLYLLIRGELKILVRSPDGAAEVVVGSVLPGSLVGEMAVLEAVPRSASGQAVVTSELLQMPGRAFAELVASAHPAAFAIVRKLQHTLAERMRGLMARVDAVFDDDRSHGASPVAGPAGAEGGLPIRWDPVQAGGGRMLNLEGVPGFDGFDAKAREAVGSMMRTANAPHDAVVVRQGARVGGAFLVVSGTMRVVRTMPSGRSVDVRDVTSGVLFGLLSCLDGGPRSTSVVARGDARVAELPRAAVIELLEGHTASALMFQVAICQALFREVRITNTRLAELAAVPDAELATTDLEPIAPLDELDDLTSGLVPFTEE